MRTLRRAWPVLVGAFAFVIYLRTLIPGLGGGGDSAKFQYLGSVLGTAHPPGYPLYIFVSYLFSHLPVGVPAYRINLMSAFFAAVTAFVVWRILDRLRSHPLVSTSAALGLAFGPIFWSKSTVAEVYTLNAALSALIVWQALRWAESGRRRDLYLTAALLGLSLGNHLTVAMLAPALALFVLATRPRDVRITTTLACVGLGALGLVQYGFILIRTWQHSPYVEAQATNLSELWHVIVASKYSGDMFRFTWHELVAERVPELAAIFRAELGTAGVLLAIVGFAAGVASKSRPALLFAASLVGVAFLTLEVDADSNGFILPAFVMAWLLAGLGMSAVVTFAGRFGRPALTIALAACACLPIAQVSANYAASDHHRRTYEARYMDAVFDMLGPRAAFVQEEYSIDQLLLYKIAGEHASRGRDIVLTGRNLDTIQSYARRGYAIYAYSDGRDRLEGLGFRFDAVQLKNRAGEPIDMEPLRLYRARAWAPCREFANIGWRDLTDVAASDPLVLRLDNYRAFDARATFYTASDTADGASLATSIGPNAAIATPTSFRLSSASDVGRLNALLDRDGVPAHLRDGINGRAFVHRLEIVANDGGASSQSTFGLGAHGRPVIGRAVVDMNDAHRGTICGWVGRTLLTQGAQDSVSFAGTDDDLFGRGWEPASKSEEDEPMRWLTSRRADLIVPLLRPAHMRVRIRAAPSDDDHAHALSIAVNGRAFPARPMPNSWHDYEWDVPAEALRTGVNAVTVDAGGNNEIPEHAAAIAALTFTTSASTGAQR